MHSVFPVERIARCADQRKIAVRADVPVADKGLHGGEKTGVCRSGRVVLVESEELPNADA